MTHEDSIYPGIIKSLAEELSNRDAQLKSERAKYLDELSAVKQQQAAMRVERNCDRLEEDLKQQKEFFAQTKAAFDLEKAELLKKVELLEQAAIHQADMLTQTRHEVEEWKGRYTTIAEEFRQCKEWSTQFSQITSALEELAEIRRKSDSGSSPTVVSSLSPNKRPSIDKAPFVDPRSQPDAIVPKTVNPISTPTRAPSSTHRQPHFTRDNDSHATSGTSAKESGSSRSRITNSAVSNLPQQNPLHHKRRRSPLGITKSSSASIPHPIKSHSHVELPPERVIITADYEIKQEDDEYSDNFDTIPKVEADRNSSYKPCGIEDEDDDIETPTAKRRRTSHKQTVRRIEDDDDSPHEADEIRRQQVRKRQQRQGPDDYDEMAIGAEDNHKEIYGYRRVHVRDGNVKPGTSISQRTENVPPPEVSPRSKRRGGPNPSPNGFIVSAKNRR